MEKLAHLEYWLRGPVPGVSALLQPAAHALLQARKEVNIFMPGFPSEKLWERPGGVAAVGFHLRHLSGVLDRLLTYARGEMLDEKQLAYLAGEGVPGRAGETADELVKRFNEQIDKALAQISATAVDSLTDVRLVGRGKIPSTVGGLIFHAAEHTQRHVGQLLVTVRVLGAFGGDGEKIRQPL